MHISNFSNKKNQFHLAGLDWAALQSYDSLVAVYHKNQYYLGPHHDYSNTTSKYVTQFTGLDTKERRKRLQEATVKTLDDLPDFLKGVLL